MAVSYQPRGEIERNGNEIVMAAAYADKEQCWTFRLTNNNVLEFLIDKSQTLNYDVWKDGLRFELVEE